MVDLQLYSNQNLFPTSYLSFSHIVGGCANSYYIREAQVGRWKKDMILVEKVFFTNVGIFFNHEHYAGASYENNDYGRLKFSPGSLQNRCEGSSNIISDFPRNIQSDSILSKIVLKSTQNL